MVQPCHSIEKGRLKEKGPDMRKFFSPVAKVILPPPLSPDDQEKLNEEWKAKTARDCMPWCFGRDRKSWGLPRGGFGDVDTVHYLT